MRLLDIISPEAVALDLTLTSREAALGAVLASLSLGEAIEPELLSLLRRREDLSSTGVGRGIAVPHVRTERVNQIRLAYGRLREGLPWGAIDGRPVQHVFLIVAPSGVNAGGYLPVLGHLAQFAKLPDTPQRLDALRSAEEFLGLLRESGL